MCFRPINVKKREIACPECNKMNPLPLTIESPAGDIMADENGKAILEKKLRGNGKRSQIPESKGNDVKADEADVPGEDNIGNAQSG